MSTQKTNYSHIFIDLVCYFYILLFVYAATSKLIDCEQFQVQLAQSPLLSAYAGVLAWLVPLSEYVLGSMLLFSSLRKVGLYGSLGLMSAFTAYIVIILNYADFVPCSCGGILESLGWTEHLIFNGVCVVLVLIALVCKGDRTSSRTRITSISLSLGIMRLSTSSVLLLFWNSEQLMHTENPFIRRYSHGVKKMKSIDLKSASYYLAGKDSAFFYLGNYRTPLRIGLLNRVTDSLMVKTIEVPEADLPSTAVQLRINPPYFYLIDGQISQVLRGDVGAWKSYQHFNGKISFNEYVLRDTTAIVARAYHPQTLQQDLLSIQMKDSLPYQFLTGILEKQVDCYFDVDGHLSYDSVTEHWVYTYNYRNSFQVLDQDVNLQYTGHTLDTLEQAQLRIDSISKPGQHKLTGSLLVNATTYSHNNLLYILSKVKGRYEPTKPWEQTETIDVYSLKDGSYRSSFYVYLEDEHRLTRFFVSDKAFYGFAGDHLIVYDLNSLLNVTH